MIGPRMVRTLFAAERKCRWNKMVPARRQPIAVSPRDFADECVRPQQPQPARDPGTGVAAFGRTARCGHQPRPQVGIAEAVDQELAPQEHPEQGAVFGGHWPQGSIAPPLLLRRSTPGGLVALPFLSRHTQLLQQLLAALLHEVGKIR